jgi:hypothetical protein
LAAAAVLGAAAAPARADTGAPSQAAFDRAQAVGACDSHLRRWDDVDPFALTPREALLVARALSATRIDLRVLPAKPDAVRRLERVLRYAAQRALIHSRAFRRDQTDDSLPAEAAFENGLLRLERAAAAAGLAPACLIRIQ